MSGKIKNTHNKASPSNREPFVLRNSQYETIHELSKSGHSQRSIARMLGIDRKTVQRHLQKEQWKAYQRSPRGYVLIEPFHDWTLARAKEVNYNASVLFRELKLKGYTGSYETVKKCVSPLRSIQSKACVRFETPPGEQAQVDWGSDHVWIGQVLTRIHFFAMVLGYSRRLFVKAYLNERFPSLIDGHESAFRHFGGLTHQILYDNPKTMILVHEHHNKQHILNPDFKDFAEHYGFEPRFCQPYRPQTKGKIESGVKYTKRNFLPGRRFQSLDHLNEEMLRWTTCVADQRIHGTTHERPIDRFEAESLVPLHHIRSYQHVVHIERKVAQDALISFQTNRYSVPWTHVGHLVDLAVKNGQLVISMDGDIIATHQLLSGKHKLSLNEAHYKGLIRSNPQPHQIQFPEHDPYFQEDESVVQRDIHVYEQLLEGFLPGLLIQEEYVSC